MLTPGGGTVVGDDGRYCGVDLAGRASAVLGDTGTSGILAERCLGEVSGEANRTLELECLTNLV